MAFTFSNVFKLPGVTLAGAGDDSSSQNSSSVLILEHHSAPLDQKPQLLRVTQSVLIKATPHAPRAHAILTD